MSAPRRALIFGATSAMAQEVVRRLAAAGAELVLVGRDEQKLGSVAADARVRGASCVEAIAADLNESDRHESLVAGAFETLREVDLVLVAQGLLADSDACEREPALAARVLLTNFASPVLLLERVGRRMARQGSGTIVGISSVAGDRGRQSNYVYGSAKAGLTAYLAGLRNRLVPAGVHVVTVKPGFVDSPMTAGLEKSRLFAPPSAVAEAILRAVERRRDVVYVPGFWRLVMLVIRHVPERLFKRLRL